MKNILLYVVCILLISNYQNLAQESDGVNIVVIDAGHGGHDPGNLGTGRYKSKEKDIALAVALKLGKYIEDNIEGVQVIFTRKTDVYIGLKERAAIANKANADLFISIHCDAFTSSKAFGATSIILGRNHDDDNLRVAKNENSVIFMEDNYEEKYEGFDPNNPQSLIALTMVQNAFLNQSVSFAQKVQDQFNYRVQRRDRGVKQQPLMVTKMAVMPSTLVELGFLTNPAEEDFLNSEKGQSLMASAIYRAFKEYKMERESFELKIDMEDEPKIEKQTPLEEAAKSTETVLLPITALDEAGPAKKVEEKINKNSTFICVQIATSAKKKSLSPENFKGLKNVAFYEDGALFKYYIGEFDNLTEAQNKKRELAQLGFKDAFIVALSEGKRIKLSKALEILQ